MICLQFSQESMNATNCTTPFGFNIDNICTAQDSSKKANTLYNQRVNNFIKECQRPCKLMKVTGTASIIEGKKSNSFIGIYFDEMIRVSYSYVTYTSLEMIAEIGGYVGLFLGISILHLKDLFSMIIDRF